MSTKLDYYFSHQERFPFSDLLVGITETYELLVNVKPFLKKLLVEPDVKENRATIKGSKPNFHGNYFIDEGTVIYNDVTIIGPVYIGKKCEILPGAIIRPNTILSDGCSVGHASEVKHCVFFEGAKIASLSFAGDSILGVSARLGSGVITANRRFDQQAVALKIGTDKVDLQDSFFGCVLGDSARLGANCVSQPGCHIGQYSTVFPLTTVRGFIPSDKSVYHPQETIMKDKERVELKP